MDRKQRFMQAVQILAPDDQLGYQATQHIPEEQSPEFPGGAALEFAAGLQKLREPINRIPVNSITDNKNSGSYVSDPTRRQLSISHQLRIQSAGYWLKLGEADEALRELEALPHGVWNHPAAIKARVAAIGALREGNQTAVLE